MITNTNDINDSIDVICIGCANSCGVSYERERLVIEPNAHAHNSPHTSSHIQMISTYSAQIKSPGLSLDGVRMRTRSESHSSLLRRKNDDVCALLAHCLRTDRISDVPLWVFALRIMSMFYWAWLLERPV